MKKVLILEDNEAHMKALTKILSSINDIEIFKAYNTAEAYYMLSLNVFDVFLVDIVLDTKAHGDVSGVDFVNYLRDNKRYQHTPVVFITSLEDPKLTAYKELHCYNYIEKPFDPQEVLNTVREILVMPVNLPKKEYVYFRKDGILYSVKVEDITHIEIGRAGTNIYTKNDYLQLGYRSAKEILNIINSTDFVQCNRNTIINKKYVEYFDFVNRYVKLNCVKEEIELGQNIKKYLDDMF